MIGFKGKWSYRRMKVKDLIKELSALDGDGNVHLTLAWCD